MQPLPLIFPTASWSSYRPSDKGGGRSGSEGSDSESSSSYKTFFPSPSCYNSTAFDYERNTSDQSNTDNDNNNNNEEDESLKLFAAAAAQQQQQQQQQQAAAAATYTKTSKLRKINKWGAARRDTRKAAHSQNLLYLAITDPALSSAALLAKDAKPYKSFCTSHGETEREEGATSNGISLSVLIIIICLLLFLSFTLGIFIGCALVRSRPSRGGAAIAVLPLSRKNENYLFNYYESAFPSAASRGVKATKHNNNNNNDNNNNNNNNNDNNKEAAAGDAAPRNADHSNSRQKGNENKINKKSILMLTISNQEDANTQNSLAVVQGAFRILIPLYGEGFFGGTESGLSLLEYLPAPLAGAAAEDICFTAASLPPSPSVPSPAPLLLLNTLENNPPPLSPSFPYSVKQQQEGATRNSNNNNTINENESGFSSSPFPAAPAALSAVHTAAAAVESSGPAFNISSSFKYFINNEGGGGTMGEFSHQSAVQTLQDLISFSDKDETEKLMTWGLCFPLYENNNILMKTQQNAFDSDDGTQNSWHETRINNLFKPKVFGNSLHEETAEGKNTKNPYLLAAAFHPLIDSQGSGLRPRELWVTINHKVTSFEMYKDLIQDCRLGRVYVQLSLALAYYTLFYWENVEYHKFLPIPIKCVIYKKRKEAHHGQSRGDSDSLQRN